MLDGYVAYWTKNRAVSLAYWVIQGCLRRMRWRARVPQPRRARAHGCEKRRAIAGRWQRARPFSARRAQGIDGGQQKRRVAVVRQARQARPKAVDIAYQSIHRMGLESPHEPALHRNLCAAGRAAQLPHDGRTPVHHAGRRVQPHRLARTRVWRAPVRPQPARGDADQRRRQGLAARRAHAQADARDARRHAGQAGLCRRDPHWRHRVHRAQLVPRIPGAAAHALPAPAG